MVFSKKLASLMMVLGAAANAETESSTTTNDETKPVKVAHHKAKTHKDHADNSHDISWLKEADIPKVEGKLMKVMNDGGHPYQIIVICGIKGAGKTSTMTQLEKKLKDANLYIEVVAPFADMNAKYKEKGSFGMFIGSAEEAREIEAAHHQLTEDKIAQFKKNLAASGKEKGVLLFDRGWLTVLTSFVVAKNLSDKECEQLWRKDWMHHIYPTAFIETNPAQTVARRKGQLDVKSGVHGDDRVWSDYFQRKHLIGRFQDWVFASHDTSSGINDAKVDHMASDIAHKIIHAFGDVKSGDTKVGGVQTGAGA